MPMSLRKFFSLIFIFFFLAGSVARATALPPQAMLYYSTFCSGCTEYIENELQPLFQEFHIPLSKADYVTDTNSRLRLQEDIERADVPREQAGHIMLFLPERNLVFGGHVPIRIIRDLLTSPDIHSARDTLYILQDEMHGNPKSYFLFRGASSSEVQIATPISEALNSFSDAKQTSRIWFPLLLIGTALLDGINPCAFAVLLFFVAFLYTIHRKRGHILRLGLLYISAIYLAYLLIGLGLLKAILFVDSPHFMAKLGVTFLIVLGVWHLVRVFLPLIPFPWTLPKAGKKAIELITERATVPAVFIGGFLVGLCTFPCSGGPYVAILTLLAARHTYLLGFLYLLLYNLFFVAPLFIILGFTGNKRTTDIMMRFQQTHKTFFRVFVALLLIALGLIIHFFFIT